MEFMIGKFDRSESREIYLRELDTDPVSSLSNEERYPNREESGSNGSTTSGGNSERIRGNLGVLTDEMNN